MNKNSCCHRTIRRIEAVQVDNVQEAWYEEICRWKSKPVFGAGICAENQPRVIENPVPPPGCDWEVVDLPAYVSWRKTPVIMVGDQTKGAELTQTSEKLIKTCGLIPFHPNCRYAWTPYIPLLQRNVVLTTLVVVTTNQRIRKAKRITTSLTQNFKC